MGVHATCVIIKNKNHSINEIIMNAYYSRYNIIRTQNNTAILYCCSIILYNMFTALLPPTRSSLYFVFNAFYSFAIIILKYYIQYDVVLRTDLIKIKINHHFPQRASYTRRIFNSHTLRYTLFAVDVIFYSTDFSSAHKLFFKPVLHNICVQIKRLRCNI